MSPHLAPGQTQLIMTWDEKSLLDLDLYVKGVENNNASNTCLVNYESKGGCTGVFQDRDNADGGYNGPETVSFLDSSVNVLYTYIIAVDDYEDNANDFINSGVELTVTNNIPANTKRYPMVVQPNQTVTYPNDFYLFGCLRVQLDGNFVFTAAPDGTFFDGDNDSEWLSMMNTYC